MRISKKVVAQLRNKAKKVCPHSNCDDDGNCHKCGKSAFSKGILYNPRVHKKLTHDKVVSIVPTRDGLWRELVGVYWKGTDGSEVLFETTPSKAKMIVEIFNARARA